MKKLRRVAIGIILSLSLLYPIVGFGLEPSDSQLLGYEDSNELLGIASAFSVFVEEDFGANGSDLEGRLFAGDSANIGTMRYYSTARSTGASVIVNSGELKNFDTGNRIFVFGTQATNLLENGIFYQRDLIDVQRTFSNFKELSSKLGEQDCCAGAIDFNWSQQVNFIGDQEINFFKLNLDLVNSQDYFFNFDIPENSYAIINVYDEEPIIYTQLYGCALGGRRISSNTDELASHILYNFPNAKKLEVRGNGTFYGTIFAPNANCFDNIKEGSHCTGGVIAKSYIGGIEFGNQTYSGKEIDFKEDLSSNEIDSIAEEISMVEESSIGEETPIFEETSIIETESKEIDLNETSLTENSSIVEINSSDLAPAQQTSEVISESSFEESNVSSFEINNETAMNPETGQLSQDIKGACVIIGILLGALLVVLNRNDKDNK